MNLGWLDPWFASFREVSHKELIAPRKTWIKCDGLPISLWNQGNWDKIIREWESSVTVESQNSDEDTSHIR